MMLRLKFMLKVLGLACAAGVCLGATFTWTDGGGNQDWANGENWSLIGLGDCAYPCSTSDDAIFPYDASAWTCELTTTSIEDLSIGGSVDFSPASGTVTLTVDSLTIGSPTATVEYEVTVTGNATIQVLDNP